MKTIWAAYALVGVTTVAFCADKDANGCQKGTIAINPTSAKKTCDLQIPNGGYQISKCEDFHDGEVVEYRLKDNMLFIRTNDSKELKRRILATYLNHDPTYQPIVWLKGTIQGYSVRRQSHYSRNNGSSLNIAFDKKIKVYELQGTEANYLIDFCGSFQVGKFVPGQEVEYRVFGERLYIRHDGDKTYACQIEGKSLPESPKPPDEAKPDTFPDNAQQNR